MPAATTITTEVEAAPVASEDTLSLAKDYAEVTLLMRDHNEKGKALKERKCEIGHDLLESMQEDEVETIRITADDVNGKEDDAIIGCVVKRYVASLKESVNADFLRVNLSTYLGKHDKPERPVNERATKATEYIYERRDEEEVERLSVRMPPKKKQPKKAKKARAVVGGGKRKRDDD